MSLNFEEYEREGARSINKGVTASRWEGWGINVIVAAVMGFAHWQLAKSDLDATETISAMIAISIVALTVVITNRTRAIEGCNLITATAVEWYCKQIWEKIGND